MPAFWRAHLGRWPGNSCYFAGVSKNRQNPLLLSALSLCPCWVVLGICLYSHFKGVFRGFPLLDVGLYCSGALRGLWGFCVREWLGGLKACGVFAFLFILFVLLLSFSCFVAAFMLFVLSFPACPLALSFLLSLWVLLFPFRMYRQNERAQRFAPCVLACRCGLCCLLHCCVWN